MVRFLILFLSTACSCFAQFPDAGEAPPPGWTGKVFKLSQDYPESYRENVSEPWMEVDFRKEPLKYVQVVYDYILEGNPECDWVVQNNTVRKWYHVPWMHWRDPRDGQLGREFINGLTRERDSRPYELSNEQHEFEQNWAIGFYNEKGGYVIGKVWANPEKPDPGRSEFPYGTVCGKLLFTHADTLDAPYLKNAPQWQAYIHTSVNEKQKKRVAPVRLLQFDIAVRDPRADDASGWVFGTLIYNGDVAESNPWKRMVPAGATWGNDAGVTAELSRHGNALKETFINPDLRDKFKFGWGGRLNGPVDNPNSGCISCHSTAQFPMVTSQSPSDNASTAERLHWFRKTHKTGESFSPGSRPLHYSLQLAIGIENFYIYNKLHPKEGTLAIWLERGGKMISGYYLFLLLALILVFWMVNKKTSAFGNSPFLVMDQALFFLRIGIGIMFIVHGLPKLTGGPPSWTRLGQSMANFGVYEYPAMWGFLAAIAETGGGLLMIAGLFFRPAMVMLSIHMTVACIKHFAGGDTLSTASHAIEALFIFLFLLITGPGRIALDRLLFIRKTHST